MEKDQRKYKGDIRLKTFFTVFKSCAQLATMSNMKLPLNAGAALVPANVGELISKLAQVATVSTPSSCGDRYIVLLKPELHE